MTGAARDALVLFGMAVFDAAVVATWYLLCSRFMPRSDTLQSPPDGADAVTHAAPSRLHGVLCAVCLMLLIGLIIECSGSAVWYVARFGFSR